MVMIMQGDERQLLKVSANLCRRYFLDLVSGRLTITDRRLHFAPGFTLMGDRTAIDISLLDIEAVTPHSRLGIFPSEFDIETRSGRVLRFGVMLGTRARVLEVLRGASMAHKAERPGR